MLSGTTTKRLTHFTKLMALRWKRFYVQTPGCCF